MKTKYKAAIKETTLIILRKSAGTQGGLGFFTIRFHRYQAPVLVPLHGRTAR